MITVSESAVIKRINRKLAKDGEQLRTLRSERYWSDLGTFYVVNADNCVTARHVDLEQWGRELGVLRAGEAVES